MKDALLRHPPRSATGNDVSVASTVEGRIPIGSTGGPEFPAAFFVSEKKFFRESALVLSAVARMFRRVGWIAM